MRLRLSHVFVLASVAIALAGASAFLAIFDWSERQILLEASTMRETASGRVAAFVSGQIQQADACVQDLEREIGTGVLQPDDRQAVGAALFAGVLNRPQIQEVTFTRAVRTGFDAQGEAVIAPDHRFQVSAYRSEVSTASPIVIRTVDRAAKGFVASSTRWQRPMPYPGVSTGPAVAATDPTTHPTFVSPAAHHFAGRALWSDLHYSQLDEDLPVERRRKVMSVQKAVEDEAGHFAGVLRVGLLASMVDQVTHLSVDRSATVDPHRVFLCDRQGRLITPMEGTGGIVEVGDDLRVAPGAPEPIASALASPALASLGESGATTGAQFAAEGHAYLVTYRALPDTQDWVAAIVVPRDHYTAALEAQRRRLLSLAAIAGAALLLLGGLIVRAMLRGLGAIVSATERMRGFDFAPVTMAAPFGDIQEVMESLERAKTSVRAMGKYLPLDLVHQLYSANREPTLGGEMLDVTLMFTDIQGFTTLSESLSPDALAARLGLYLETMATAIQGSGGTIDKYIGDAVMAFWNAPTRRDGHAGLACRAALDCRKATAVLFASPSWGGEPPLVTRIGIHNDRVMVGHFGAMSRLSYTALGDGVNLASRLEGLCKQYGVTTIASETVAEQAKDEFEFRLLDLVAVKGKKRGVRIFELLGDKGRSTVAPEIVTRYEEAFAAYQKRDFARALDLLSRQRDDPPSAALAARCTHLTSAPPPADWDGVYVATSK